MNQENSTDQVTGARSWKLIESLSLSPWLLFGLLVLGIELYFASQNLESHHFVALNVILLVYSILGISLSPSLGSVTHGKNKILRNALIYLFALIAAGVYIPEYVSFYFEGMLFRTARVLGASVQENGWQFYVHHLFALNVLPALVAGYVINIRHKPKAVLWIWIIPVSVVGYKILTFHSTGLVSGNGVEKGIAYFFASDCLPGASPFESPECSSGRTMYLPPSYATVAYAVGAFVAYSGVLRDFVPRRALDD